MERGVAALLLGLALAACPGGKSAAPAAGSSVPAGSGAATAPVVIADAGELAAHAGAQVAVRGTAEDAKLGAEVTLGKVPVYCLMDQRWPGDVAGTQVTARGLLEHTDELADEADPALPGAGTSGAVWVLRSCVYDGPK